MPPGLADITAPGHWPAFALVTARLGGLVFTAPLWSMNALPRPVRAAITVVLAMALLPAMPPVTLSEHVLDLPLMFGIEIVIGLAIGLTAAALVQGVTLAGEVLAMQMGLSLGPALSPVPDFDASAVAQLQGLLALFLYVTTGSHLVLIEGLATSLRVLPPGLPVRLDDGGMTVAAILGSIFTCAVAAAGPVMVALLLANVGLALLSRAVPQLNPMMVSLPVTIGVGLAGIGLALPQVAGVVERWMEELGLQVARTLQAFAITS